MWTYATGLSLAAMHAIFGLSLSLAYAPVPPDQSSGTSRLVWTLVGVVFGVAFGLLIYKILGGSKGKTRR